MKVLNFGSLNYDHVYKLDHFVQPKETASSLAYDRGFGGKGLNQSIALAKAGVEVYHAGRVGKDGQDFIEYLNNYGVNTTYLVKDDALATGHAIIEVCQGENRIILHGGANQEVSREQIDETVKDFAPGDILLIQNEISNISYLITRAHDLGLKVVFNTAPMNKEVFNYPLALVDTFVVNEVEGAGLINCESDKVEDIINGLKMLHKEVILTVGAEGSYYINGDELIYKPAFKVSAVDTTAAGDTFTGYYLAGLILGRSIEEALALAAKAASITVTGEGAAKSIPLMKEVER